MLKSLCEIQIFCAAFKFIPYQSSIIIFWFGGHPYLYEIRRQDSYHPLSIIPYQ